jgi:hypothetical protein
MHSSIFASVSFTRCSQAGALILGTAAFEGAGGTG